jgi:hypothetical protein
MCGLLNDLRKQHLEEEIEMPTVQMLNDAGVSRFRDYLCRLSNGDPIPPPSHLLDDAESTCRLSRDVCVDQRPFGDKQDAAAYLCEQFAGLERAQVDHNVGLWAWLSLFYFDQVCPAAPNGLRNPGEFARHIPEPRAYRYYRHLLAGPYRLLQLHGERARLFLDGPLPVHGDMSEQLASRQEFITNAGLVEVVDRLYFDAESSRRKRGALTRSRPGNVRRLVTVVQQFDLTYDLFGMNAEQILNLLPAEFQAWRNN